MWQQLSVSEIFLIISTEVSVQGLAHREYIASALSCDLEDDYILGL